MPLLPQAMIEKNNGEMSERPMEHAWKVCKQKCFQGSNPCLTAINKKPDFQSGFLFVSGEVRCASPTVPIQHPLR